ncbi:MAG: hypothetical protein K2M55_01375 [Muribaculaceae bacterium]|nr:hypothetical protein [Muribaculaceae bacterium]
MIFNFRIVSDEVDNFKREIQIDSTATFMELKKAICQSVGYHTGQMSSFFLCDSHWEKEKEVTSEDMDTDPDQDIWLMDETPLDELIEDEGQKLLYVFDYLTERAFFMEMTEMITGRNLHDPVCTLAVGAPPAESVDLDEFDAKIDAKASTAATVTSDMDEDFYGNDSYNEDEFDAAGYDEMTFDE